MSLIKKLLIKILMRDVNNDNNDDTEAINDLISSCPNFKEVYKIRKGIRYAEITIIILLYIACIIGFYVFKEWWINFVRYEYVEELHYHNINKGTGSLEVIRNFESYVSSGIIAYLLLTTTGCLFVLTTVVYLEDHDFFIKKWNIRDIVTNYKINKAKKIIKQ